MVKIIEKILKVFFIFLSIVLAAGFVMLTVRNYVMPEVDIASIQENGMLATKYEFTGIVMPRHMIEVKADSRLYVDELKVKAGQIAPAGSPLMIFDVSKQSSSDNSRISDLKIKIRELELDKLSCQSSLEQAESRCDSYAAAMKKSEERFEQTSVLYESGAVTEKEYEDDKYDYETAKADYDSSINDLSRERELYNATMAKIGEETSAVNRELSDELGTDDEVRVTYDETGAYSVGDKIYIDYLSQDRIIEEGDLVLRYAVYNTKADLKIEAAIDRDDFEHLVDGSPEIVFWRKDEKKKNKASIEQRTMYADHGEMIFTMNDETQEAITVMDVLKFTAQTGGNYPVTVPRTAVVPIGGMKVGNACYVYVVKEETSLLGKTNRLFRGRYNIDAVGSSRVAISNDAGDTASPILTSDIKIANYVSSLLEDGMAVRVRK